MTHVDVFGADDLLDAWGVDDAERNWCLRAAAVGPGRYDRALLWQAAVALAKAAR